ncbi:MAG: hypothetical protein O7A98_08035 [Acidobacteria bacterium]|nr:hypothetical protein [Acidobacteriota bacterium]
MAEREPFYIGYEARVPAPLVRHIRRVVVLVLLLAVGVASLVVALQQKFVEAHFEYGNVQSFEGRLAAEPYPTLTVTAPSAHAGETLLLVDRGKKGAESRVTGLDNHRVRLSGQLIHRRDSAMIELASAPVEDLGPARLPAPIERSLGEHRLIGEIVDSKCHLGVMKPGEGKPHRACAARCLDGGSPPLLWVRSRDGGVAHYLLAGRDGRALGRELLHVVAEPVSVAGELVRRGELWMLYTEPIEIERVAPDAG